MSKFSSPGSGYESLQTSKGITDALSYAEIAATVKDFSFSLTHDD